MHTDEAHAAVAVAAGQHYYYLTVPFSTVHEQVCMSKCWTYLIYSHALTGDQQHVTMQIW